MTVRARAADLVVVPFAVVAAITAIAHTYYAAAAAWRAWRTSQPEENR